MTAIEMREDSRLVCLGIDHIHFYLHNAEQWGQWYQQVWGFQFRGQRRTSDTLSLWLSQGSIHLVLSQAQQNQGPVAAYLRHHGEGIADVALRIKDAAQAHDHLVEQGQVVRWLWSSEPLRQLQLYPPLPSGPNPHHRCDFCHSLIERSGSEAGPILPGFVDAVPSPGDGVDPLQLSHIDHVVINVPQQALASVSAWYRQIFDWQLLYQYTITTQLSGLNSQVVGPASALEPPLLIALNEPLGSASQIQEFISANRGPGIQHVALHSRDIFHTIATLRGHGVAFIPVPEPYYQQLPAKLPGCDRQQVCQHQILVDQNQPQKPDQILLQIFTQPLFSEPTFFFEVIQRQADATGFGEANFQALFEAIERQQQQRAYSSIDL